MNEYEIPKTNRPLGPIFKLIIATALVIVLVMVTYYVTKVNKAVSSESREVNITIEKGGGSKQIAYQLKDERVINSPNIFLIYTTLHSAGSKFQAGQYVLNANMSIPEIVDILTHGKVVSDARTVTIVEGWSNKQIAKYLIDRKILDSMDTWNEVLLKDGWETFRINEQAHQVNYEGFLFPDTYKLGKDENVYDLVVKMLANFEIKLTTKTIDDLQAQGPEHLKEIITMASIIEKEVGRNKGNLTDEDLKVMHQERLLVASVFYNRLKIGMPLESDATVNFVTGKADRSVSIADTKINSPYNTYQHRGLPPTPISNPGIDSILAAISPSESDYLYFLNSPDGTAYFGKTLAEHSANRAKYLR